MVEYKEFRVGDLFDVKSTKKTIHKNMIESSDWGGQHPYITRTTQNNGLSGYIGYDEDFLNDGNTISLGLDTYTLSYQKTPYFTGNKVKVLYLKNRVLNSRIAMYLISVYNRMFQGYDWGTGINQQAIVNMKLSLPATPQGQPDFDFMENYIKEIEQKHISKLEAELEARTETMLRLIGREDLIGDVGALGALVEQGFEEKVEYGEFTVGELFEVKRGKRLKGADREPGEVVYCSATQTNNGVTDYIDNPLFLESNKITVSTFLDVFYQEGAFTASDEITMLGAEWLNRRSGQFIAASIKKSREGKYGYGHKAFSKEVSGFEIELPATADGTPDFEYMERYIAYIELKHTHTAYVAECERIDLMRQLVI